MDKGQERKEEREGKEEVEPVTVASVLCDDVFHLQGFLYEHN